MIVKLSYYLTTKTLPRAFKLLSYNLTSACQDTLSDKDVLNSSTKADIYITNRIKCQYLLSKMWFNIFITSVVTVVYYIVIV